MLHFGHNVSGRGLIPSFARRLPEREFECFLFGTAIISTWRRVLCETLIRNFSDRPIIAQRLISVLSVKNPAFSSARQIHAEPVSAREIPCWCRLDTVFTVKNAFQLCILLNKSTYQRFYSKFVTTFAGICEPVAKFFSLRLAKSQPPILNGALGC